jgi:soluble lytic murein transglycosylase-like protein
VAQRLKSGASVPTKDATPILAALNRVATIYGVDPAAIAAMIHTESVWNTRNVTGSYIGLTQVGPEIPKKLGLTRAGFLNLSAAEQISAYGTWLEYYRFKKQMKDHAINCLILPLARQAAVLQAMQFAPNAKKWKIALSKGNVDVPSTKSPQAKFLGDTSIRDMEKYYAGFFKKRPPVYSQGTRRRR